MKSPTSLMREALKNKNRSGAEGDNCDSEQLSLIGVID